MCSICVVYLCIASIYVCLLFIYQIHSASITHNEHDEGEWVLYSVSLLLCNPKLIKWIFTPGKSSRWNSLRQECKYLWIWFKQIYPLFCSPLLACSVASSLVLVALSVLSLANVRSWSPWSHSYKSTENTNHIAQTHI